MVRKKLIRGSGAGKLKDYRSTKRTTKSKSKRRTRVRCFSKIGEIEMATKGIGKMIRDRCSAKKMRNGVARKQRSGHRVEPHASSVDRTEQNPAVQSSDYHAQTPRSTWEPTQGLVGPGLVYFGPNQTPTSQQDAAPVLHDRPLNLHPHHRYLPIGKEMNKRADDAGIGCRIHTLAHLERALRRPSTGEMHAAGKVL